MIERMEMQVLGNPYFQVRNLMYLNQFIFLAQRRMLCYALCGYNEVNRLVSLTH